MRQELRHAFRVFRTHPGFAGSCVLMLALGIGASSVMFTVVDAVLLQPLSYHESDRLVWIWSFDTRRALQQWTSFPDFLDWRSHSRTLEHFAGWGEYELTLTGAGGPERVRAVLVSAGFFDLVGVAPQRGTADVRGDSRVVLSDAFWQRRFGGDPALVGRDITLSGDLYTVTGVMPPSFRFPIESPADLWIIVRDDQFNPALRNRRDARLLEVMARLRSGVTIEQAQAEMDVVAANLRRAHPDTNADIGIRIMSAVEQIAGRVSTALWALSAAVAGVLLIACANAANLLLARSTGRRAEFAMRAALGAGRGHLVRQLLIESVPIVAAAGVLAGVLAVWGVAMIVRLLPAGFPRGDEIAVNARSLLFAAAVSMATALVASVLPAFRLSRTGAGAALREAPGPGSSHAGGKRLSNALVTLQVALAMVLLIGAALLVNSFARLTRDDPGYDPRHVLTFRLDWPSATYRPNAAAQAFAQVQERLAALPGVQAASVGLQLPDRGAPLLDQDLPLVDIEGRPRPPNQRRRVSTLTIQPDYFRVLGIPLVRGRDLNAADRFGGQPVVVINQSLAAEYFGERDPVGQRLLVEGWTTGERAAEVVGVAGDVTHRFLDRKAAPIVYLPLAQAPTGAAHVVVKTTGDPLALVGAVREAIRSVDSDQPIYDVQTLEQRIDASLTFDRFATMVMGVFAALALLLSAGGLYAMLAYSVARRGHELGIRAALGAAAGDVLALVLRDGVRIVAGGLALGTLAGLFAARALEGLLFGVATTDPFTLLLAALILSVVGLVACWVPARSAARIDPLAALRASPE